VAGALRISEAESQVMAAVWAAEGPDGPAARAEEILAAVGPVHGWTESTVRTLIHRLIRKGALRSERRRGAVVYAALVRRQDWVTAESQGLLDRLFGGQLAPLVDHFTKARAVAPEDLARLKRLVAELDRDAADEDG
jgi:BlaI family penicillinase repressor